MFEHLGNCHGEWRNILISLPIISYLLFRARHWWHTCHWRKCKGESRSKANPV